MTLWRREHEIPPSFPQRVRLGRNAVGWAEHEIESWCTARVAERDAQRNDPVPANTPPLPKQH